MVVSVVMCLCYLCSLPLLLFYRCVVVVVMVVGVALAVIVVFCCVALVVMVVSDDFVAIAVCLNCVLLVLFWLLALCLLPLISFYECSYCCYGC